MNTIFALVQKSFILISVCLAKRATHTAPVRGPRAPARQTSHPKCIGTQLLSFIVVCILGIGLRLPIHLVIVISNDGQTYLAFDINIINSNDTRMTYRRLVSPNHCRLRAEMKEDKKKKQTTFDSEDGNKKKISSKRKEKREKKNCG